MGSASTQYRIQFNILTQDLESLEIVEEFFNNLPDTVQIVFDMTFDL
jgi:hypothetical protein